MKFPAEVGCVIEARNETALNGGGCYEHGIFTANYLVESAVRCIVFFPASSTPIRPMISHLRPEVFNLSEFTIFSVPQK